MIEQANSLNLKQIEADLSDCFFRMNLSKFARRLLLSRFKILPLELIHRILPENGDILEIGCGQGVVAQVMARLSPARKITGCDLSEGRILTAKRLAQQCKTADRLRFKLADAGALPFAPGFFSAAFMAEVLYLVPYDSQKSVLCEVSRVLRPNGLFLLCEPIKTPTWGSRYHRLQSTILTFLSNLPGGRTLFGHRLRGSPFLRRPEEIISMLNENGFLVQKKQRVHRAFYPHLVLTARTQKG